MVVPPSQYCTLDEGTYTPTYNQCIDNAPCTSHDDGTLHCQYSMDVVNDGYLASIRGGQCREVTFKADYNPKTNQIDIQEPRSNTNPQGDLKGFLNQDNTISFNQLIKTEIVLNLEDTGAFTESNLRNSLCAYIFPSPSQN